REIEIPTSRGQILDRNGEPLAVSTPVESLWVNPPVLMEHADRIPELAQALGIDAAALHTRVAEKAAAKREFDYLRRHMSPEKADAVMALDIPGINKLREFRR